MRVGPRVLPASNFNIWSSNFRKWFELTSFGNLAHLLPFASIFCLVLQGSGGKVLPHEDLHRPTVRFTMKVGIPKIFFSFFLLTSESRSKSKLSEHEIHRFESTANNNIRRLNKDTICPAAREPVSLQNPGRYSAPLASGASVGDAQS